MPKTAKSPDHLQRRSLIEYLDRVLENNDTHPDAKPYLRRMREWVRRWRPRASKRPGGLGR